MYNSPLYLLPQGRKRRRSKRKTTLLMIPRFILFITGIFLSCTAFAQEVEMADSMRSNGKIYVVVAVCLTILIGLFIYVLLLDKKISRFEKNNE